MRRRAPVLQRHWTDPCRCRPMPRFAACATDVRITDHPVADYERQIRHAPRPSGSRGAARFLEGNRQLSHQGRNDSSALGEAGVDARAPTSARQARFGRGRPVTDAGRSSERNRIPSASRRGRRCLRLFGRRQGASLKAGRPRTGRLVERGGRKDDQRSRRVARSWTGCVLGPGQGPHAALCPSDRWLGPAGPDRFGARQHSSTSRSMVRRRSRWCRTIRLIPRGRQMVAPSSTPVRTSAQRLRSGRRRSAPRPGRSRHSH